MGFGLLNSGPPWNTRLAMPFSVWNLSNLDWKPDLKLALTPSGDMAWAFLVFSFLVVIT